MDKKVNHFKISWKTSKFGNRITRTPKSIGPIHPDHNHWDGSFLSLSEKDAKRVSAALQKAFPDGL